MNQSFTRASDTLGLLRVPEHLFATLPARFAKEAAPIRWVCPVCGPQEPLRLANGYSRARCACERAAQERALTQEATRAYLENRARACYHWLPNVDDSELASRDFASFNPLAQPNSAAFVQAKGVALDFAAQVISSFTRQRVALDNLTMRGGYGTGKTHLAAAICNALRQAGVSCRFCAVPDLFSALYAADFGDKQAIIEEAARVPLLVLDDLDKLHVRQETDGEYQKKVLFEIVNGRYKRHVPTLITTNATDDLSRWLDGASLSRLHERLTTLTMIGVDYRRRKA